MHEVATRGKQAVPLPLDTLPLFRHTSSLNGEQIAVLVPDLREGCGPEPVGKHPTAASPYGVADMLGNVWQFTADEFVDDHTRRVVLRGGSNYHPTDPTGDGWYFPQAKSLATHNTLLLMDDSYERAATVGFRCVIDA